MNKRHLQNCLSREKKTFESNIKKYKTLIKIERENSVESEKPQKIESMSSISDHLSSEPEASTSASGLFSKEVKCSEFLETGRADTESVLKSSRFVESNSYPNIDSKAKPQENTQVDAHQSEIPRKPYALLGDGHEPLPLSTSSLPKNEDIFDLLKKIAQSIERVKENQSNILQNQSILSQDQSCIVVNQQVLANKLETIEATMIAQSKTLMECKVAVRKIEAAVCRMTGEAIDRNLDEVSSMLPLQTLAAVQEVEQQLDTPDFAQAMTTYLHKLKGTSEDVSSVIRAIFTDDLLEKYNWEGRWEKHALKKLNLFNKTLRDVFQQQGAFEFEKSVRKAVERSHHRVKQNKYLKKSK